MRDTFSYSFSRILRTLSSEIYIIYEGKEKIGEAHLSYVANSVFCTILIEIEEPDIEGILEALEADVVSSCMPEYERDDFSVTIFQAKEIDSFSYSQDMFNKESEEEDGTSDED